jgi:hypothetical protein
VAAFKRNDMESGMRHFVTAVLGRGVYCRLDAARLEHGVPRVFQRLTHRLAELLPHAERKHRI